MRTVYAVSIEDDNSGAVDWYSLQAAAVRKYEGALVEFPGDEINLFAWEVDDDLDDECVTRAVDEAMWDRSYTPIRWRAGKNHSAEPHATPPTD